ncbi:exopolysaccharide production repressor protein [Mesorhizobium sp.]
MLRPTSSQYDLAKTRRMALHFISFCRLVGLVLCSNASMVYFALDSLRVAVVTKLACSLLLQACYFGSVLFLIWQSSSRARGTRHRGQHADSYRKARVPVV